VGFLYSGFVSNEAGRIGFFGMFALAVMTYPLRGDSTVLVFPAVAGMPGINLGAIVLSGRQAERNKAESRG
jgi:hypothetical protein